MAKKKKIIIISLREVKDALFRWADDEDEIRAANRIRENYDEIESATSIQQVKKHAGRVTVNDFIEDILDERPLYKNIKLNKQFLKEHKLVFK